MACNCSSSQLKLLFPSMYFNCYKDNMLGFFRRDYTYQFILFKLVGRVEVNARGTL